MKNEENKTDSLSSYLEVEKINYIKSIGLNGKNHLKSSPSWKKKQHKLFKIKTLENI